MRRQVDEVAGCRAQSRPRALYFFSLVSAFPLSFLGPERLKVRVKLRGLGSNDSLSIRQRSPHSRTFLGQVLKALREGRLDDSSAFPFSCPPTPVSSNQSVPRTVRSGEQVRKDFERCEARFPSQNPLATFFPYSDCRISHSRDVRRPASLKLPSPPPFFPPQHLFPF